MLNLKFQRVSKEWTQDVLASKSNVAKNYISLAENKRLIPTPQMQLKLANALGWSDAPAKLFEEKED